MIENRPLKPRYPPGWWDWDPRRNEPVEATDILQAASRMAGAFAQLGLASSPVRFVDVSHWQGAVDWGRVAAAGRVAGICKVTEGTTFVDDYARRNLEGMARAGMIPGGYLFLRRGQHVPAQVDAYLRVLGDPDGKLVCFDAETAGNGTSPTRAEVFDVAEELRRRTGRWPIAYIPRWWWNSIGGGLGPVECPLWQSAYSASPGSLFGGWSRFSAWQFTSSAAVPGVNGRCDDNLWYGTRASLAAAAGLGTGGDEIDMATIEELKQAVRSVLNEGTAPGQEHWAGTNKATLATAQGLVNQVNQANGGIGRLLDAVTAAGPAGTVDVAALAVALRDALGPELAGQVATELGRRLHQM